MITRIPEAFVIACIVSAALNVSLALIIAGMAHSWGITKGKLATHEELMSEAKATPIRDAFTGRRND